MDALNTEIAEFIVKKNPTEFGIRIPSVVQNSQIFNIFAIFCLYVMEYAENWVNFVVLQKMLLKFCFSQNVPKVTWNWPKDNIENSKPCLST